MIRRHWRGWNIVLFEDRGSPHVAEDSLELADELAIEVRLLPRACPELNPMDHLFRFVKGRALANRPTKTIDDSAQSACDFIFKLNCKERLTKAGILSPRFWLSF
jgi:transposase